MTATGVLLINLGTPDAPTPAALRRYLKEFLLDTRVVESGGVFSRLCWQLILRGIILPFRARASAAKYALIWGQQGSKDSPLREHTRRQAEKLAEALFKRSINTNDTHDINDTRRPPPRVFWAMRYGNPTLAGTLTEMRAAGIERILILPLYPQYAASTTASALDAVCAWLKSSRNQPELRVVRSFPTHPAYLDALEANIREHWAQHGSLPPDGKLLLSFHGLPEKSRALGDPYYDECQKTCHCLAKRLGLNEGTCRMTFQSRFGREAWLMPDTFATLRELGREGTRRIDIFCPGFASDCLETLEEIALRGKQTFLMSAYVKNAEFNYIPALNESPAWISALSDIADGHLKGAWAEGWAA